TNQFVFLVMNIYIRLVSCKADQRSFQGGSRPGAQEVSDLDQAKLPSTGLDPVQQDLLCKRVEALLKPLVAELPTLLDEFGIGAGDRERALRQAWFVIEANIMKPEELSTERIIRAREAALKFGINQDYLTQLAIKGRLGEKRGGLYLFSEKELIHFVR